MGFLISRLVEVFEGFKDNPAKVLIRGLDGAGKTTTLYKLKLNEVVPTTIPTIGFNVETVNPCDGLTMTVWDVGGGCRIKPLLKHYYPNTDGLIFVVDSTDTERLDQSHEELCDILESEEMRGVPLLVLANKQDLPKAQPLPKIVDAFGLRALEREWHIQGCCAVNGEGLAEGMEKFSDMIKTFKKAERIGKDQNMSL